MRGCFALAMLPMVAIAQVTGGAGGAQINGTPTAGNCANFVDAFTIGDAGAACGGSGGTPANPTATIGSTAVNGVATTYMRSDAAPKLGNLTGDVTSTGLATTLANIPAISGANLTTLNGSNISSGTVADARLSANVDLLNGNQTFTGTRHSLTRW